VENPFIGNRRKRRIHSASFIGYPVLCHCFEATKLQADASNPWVDYDEVEG
jgi:hypothetical protein